MDVQKVGSRGLVFTFEDPYKLNLYVILGDKHTFVCDTGFGSDTIHEMMNYLKEENIETKPFIVFNSHADYDHVWGNHMFRKTLIVAHEHSPHIFELEGEEMLKSYGAHKRGDVILTPPNFLFNKRIYFVDEEIEFYHTPGHTMESSSCFDHRDKILFVGDNLEDPLPYINFLNLEDYIESLEEYLSRDSKIYISGHDDVKFDTELLESNLEYLKAFIDGKVDRSNFTKKHRGIHFMNLTRVGKLLRENKKYEKASLFYKQALEILEDLEEKKPEIEERIKEIKTILEEIA